MMCFKCDSFGRARILAASALVVVGFALPVQAVTVLVSGTNQAEDQALVDFIEANFQDVDLTYADYSNYGANSAAIESANLFVLSRQLSSGAYGNATYSASFNALTVPVVAFTSYVARPDGDRWGWHDGGIAGGPLVDGDETVVTAAGAGVFGVAEGAVDWFPGTGQYFDTGTGSVGDGEILATMTGSILAAHWNAGDLSGTGVAFGSERLLFNLAEDAGSDTFLPNGAGQQALINALSAYTPLVPVPEPATLSLLGCSALLLLFRRK